MVYNSWKVVFVLSALLIFAFPGELAAQIADDLVLLPSTAIIGIDTDEDFIARLTVSGTGVAGEMVYFSLSPGLGELDDYDVQTDLSGYAAVTYTALTTSGTDTLVAIWYEPESRQDLADTSIIAVVPGAATKLRVTPEDTVVAVAEDVIIMVELFDDYDNHVNAASASQVSFATSGLGTFEPASVNVDGCIEVAYNTDDRMARDTIRIQLISNEYTDYSFIRTIGAAPAAMILNAEDSTVVVSETDNDEDLWFYLFDACDNPSTWADYYAGVRYSVTFTVSGGGGVFKESEVEVIEGGYGYTYYYSSTVAGLYTVTATSGAATADVAITQIPDYPVELVITPSSASISAGADITLTAGLFDQYSNHCDADDERFNDVEWEEISGEGDLGTPYIEDHNWKCVFSSYLFAPDTARIRAAYEGAEPDDEVVIFSVEPGEFDHYALYIIRDSVNVSDGDLTQINMVRLEAQDAINRYIPTYNNEATVTVSINESTADSFQVTWFTLSDTLNLTDLDTIVGLTAPVPESSFVEGKFYVAIANQVAETVTITATDTSGHTGISPAVTWLPINVVRLKVQLEGGETTIWPYDTLNIEVTAIDTFGNVTDVGLPLNVVLSANRAGVVFPAGATQLMKTAVDLYPMVATQYMSGLIITVEDIINPDINGSSYPINVGTGVEEEPIVSAISAAFGTGDISYAVAEDGEVSIKVYNKLGMEVGFLVNGTVERGYYQASLKGLNLVKDIYFVVMKGPGIDKKIKATLIE